MPFIVATLRLCQQPRAAHAPRSDQFIMLLNLLNKIEEEKNIFRMIELHIMPSSQLGNTARTDTSIDMIAVSVK